MSRPRVLAVVGTRPEAIKMAPVIRALKGKARLTVCSTGQHRELLDAALRDLSLRPSIRFRSMRPGQSLDALLHRVIRGVDAILRKTPFDIVIVQGDTTTTLGAALAAFRRGVPVAHVEAGLRSHDLREPYPEEGNRVIVDRIASLWFAPTDSARRNLRAEGVPVSSIVVTGNTAVDSILWAARRSRRLDLPKGRVVVVTLHRRESFGKRLDGMLRALERAAAEQPDRLFVFPVHPNPVVRSAVRRIVRHPRILTVPPLGYLDFVSLMKSAELIVTDSGGIQEEAPSLGKPVLVMRDKTERGEALRSRHARLIGASGTALLKALRRPVRALRPRKNPFGDGKAGARIARRILSEFAFP